MSGLRTKRSGVGGMREISGSKEGEARVICVESERACMEEERGIYAVCRGRVSAEVTGELRGAQQYSKT